MSIWSRIGNVWRGDRVSREIEEEFEAHIEEAVEQGRDREEARRAFGGALRRREESRDFRMIPWLDSVRADAVFGWRQLVKRKMVSAAAILSLALGIGSSTAAFRLIDALLLRPLPVAGAERLYAVARQQTGPDGKPATYEGWAYPAFRRMRAAVKDQAELIAASSVDRTDVVFGDQTEKANVQYVSGWMFEAFGLRPAAGRLLSERDDLEPGGHPYAVLSEDYWRNRFAKDPKVVGRTFRMGKVLYEIAGVTAGPFTGTEPGLMTDVFVPTMMNPAVERANSTWHATLAQLKPGVAMEPVREKLDAISLAFETERAKGFAGMSKRSIDNWLKQRVVLEPATAGASGLQKAYRRGLTALGALVALVLLIACANVANLMTAQAAARGREMALRVSIGAGRRRLVQLVLVESAWVALLAGALGAGLAWWSAPFVMGRINPADNPVRLALPADCRVLGFGLALVAGVTLLFGLAPALRASSVKPASALRGGEDPHSRRRLMHALVAAQTAFSVLVLFVAGLFAATLERLTHQPTGFSAERLLCLETTTEHALPAVFWEQVVEHLRGVQGVETAALASRPLLSGYSSNDAVAVDGGPPSEDMAYFLSVSPGWLEAMKIPLLEGRDFRASDAYPGSALVNETFARRFFHGRNPVGRVFEEASDDGSRLRLQVVGLVRDAKYSGIRQPILPVAYVPFRSAEGERRGTFLARTSTANPLMLAAVLRREIAKARSEFHVDNIRTQEEIDGRQTIRERLLAGLAAFFALVALLLAGVGLYGVLDYTVAQRRREIGIRMAIGARPGSVARLVTRDVFGMVATGALAGLALGIGAARSIESLLYEVKATAPDALAFPALAMVLVAALAALPAVIHALRITPARILRSE